MANYDEWNSSLIAYFVAGVPRGTAIFLSVDDDVLDWIGNTSAHVGEGSADFCRAVRERVVRDNYVNLHLLHGLNEQGEPKCVAFLGAMILAASRMAEEGSIDQANYFERLRQVLLLPDESGRRLGMETGEEEAHWQAWNSWLLQQGFASTARAGSGSQRFINYPISQALLRGSDKERLLRLFQDKRWPKTWGAETLMAHVRHEARWLTRHLEDLITSPGPRYSALSESVHELYESWAISADDYAGSHDWRRQRLAAGDPQATSLRAGLYRTEDPMNLRVSLYIYPVMPRHRKLKEIVVSMNGKSHKLSEDRPGWFRPIGPIGKVELENGSEYQVEQPEDITRLLLPQRDFWVLIRDPENPDSEVYASWSGHSVNDYFIILYHAELKSQLDYLRDERLIQWRGEPELLWEDSDWYEIHDCAVVSKEWAGVKIENRGLYEELRPKNSLNVSISGGLHSPGGEGWIDGHGPHVTVFGFRNDTDVRSVDVRVERMLHSGAATILSERRPTNEPFSVEWPGPGDYRIEASSGPGNVAQRIFRIVSWDDIPVEAPQHHEEVHLGDWILSGALLQRSTDRRIEIL